MIISHFYPLFKQIVLKKTVYNSQKYRSNLDFSAKIGYNITSAMKNTSVR